MTAKPSSGSKGQLGVDTGGTFTDVVCLASGVLRVHKLASTPDAPEKAVIDGAAHFIDGDAAQWRIVHGSTVATNALLENRLARTAYVTNTGFADVLTIARQARSELYALEPVARPVPVPAERCLEIDQRTGANGEAVQPLNEAAIDDLVRRVVATDAEAVAINLLFCFLDDSAERRIAEALQAAQPALAVCRSSDVLAEYGEYERGIATWLNAALGPTMGGYLARLEKAFERVAIMHGAAGTLAIEQAAGKAVMLLLSGPAGGLLGARFVGAAAGYQRLLTLDMGGTSSDVAFIDNDIRLTSKSNIAGYPVAVPMVDMHTIGAGGGSIAWIDAGGLLQVGPQSAGAEPGPACYGQSGDQATVTDAHVVLGRLPASTRLGGRMTLDTDAARQALARIAQPLELTVEAAAEGVIHLTNEAMAGALRVMSVQRGEDVADDCLLCFGGAGPLHICELAEAMQMRHALVPVYAGVLSALGMLVARRTRELSVSVLEGLEKLEADDVEQHLTGMRERGLAELAAEDVPATDVTEQIGADLRYAGQSASLNLRWQAPDALIGAFHEAHEARFGHRLDMPVELVNLRLRLAGPLPEIELPEIEGGQGATAAEHVSVHGVNDKVRVYARDALRAGHTFDGPAIVREDVSTTWIAAGWRCEVDRYGNLRLENLTPA